MIRKIISVCFYIMGGFFIYTVCILSFINIPEVGSFKFAIVGGFCVPALIFIFIGAAICRFQNWKSSVGIVLISSVGFNLLVVITFICFLVTPEIDKLFPAKSLSYFNDYLSGFTIMLLLASLGGFLLKKNKMRIAEPGNTADR